MSAHLDSPTSSHNAPQVFFRGQYIFRTFNGAIAVVSGLLLSTISTAIAASILSMDTEWLALVVAGIFAAVALVFGGAGLWAAWGCVFNRRVYVEVNENGIIHGHRFWPWSRVRSFAGTRYDNGVCLGFTPRDTGVWGGGNLDTTPLLTVQQYADLAQRLSKCIATRFPDLEVAMHPLKPTS